MVHTVIITIVSNDSNIVGRVLDTLLHSYCQLYLTIVLIATVTLSTTK
jgi:hypothetical protein